jgi:hypothetical protein
MYVGLGADITQTWPNLTVSGYPTTSQLQAANAAAAASLPTAALPTTQSSGALYYDASGVAAAADPSGNGSSAAPLCISGEITINGQCVPIVEGLEDWFLYGNNALYVGLGVLAFAVLMGMGRR